MKRIIAVLLLLSALLVGCGGNESDIKYNLDNGEGLTTEQKQKDVEYLMDMLATNYIYQDIKPEAPSKLFLKGSTEREKATKKIVNAKDDREFFYEIAKFTGSLGNFHTTVTNDYPFSYAYMPEMSGADYGKAQRKWRELISEYRKNSFSPPFFMSDYVNCIVTKSFIPEIKSGDQILSINNKSPEENMLQTAWCDENTFPMKIKVRGTDKKEKTVKYEGHAQEEYLTARKSKDDFCAEILEGASIGYLRVPSMNPKYKTDVDEFFQKAQGCSDIIVDVRGNGGGDWSVMSQLIANISKQEENTLRTFKFKGQNIVLKGLAEKSYLFYYGQSSKKVSSTTPINDDCTAYEFEDVIDTQNIKPLKGNIYVLQDEGCYSSAGIFLEETRCAELDVTTVGMPSASSGAINSSIKILPESKLMVRVASNMYISENGEIDELVGVVPDYKVEKATAEVMSEFYSNNPDGDFYTSEYDPQFMKVMELIEQSQK